MEPGPGHWGRFFFGELYRASTLPLLGAERTAADVRAIRALLDLPAGARVLDLGCGHGRHAVPLAGTLRVVALDIDEVSLALAGTTARSAGVVLPRLRADLGFLPLAAGSLDGAYAWYSSLLLFDDATHASMFACLRRALRPGGVLLHQSIDPGRLKARPAAHVSRPLPRGGAVVEDSRFDPATGRDEGLRRIELPGGRVLEARFSIRYPTPAELCRLATGAGFASAEVREGAALGLAPGAIVLRALA